MPVVRLNTEHARKKLQAFAFTELFIEELGWNRPASRKPVMLEHEGARWCAQEVSQLSGFRVFEITPEDKATPLPGAAAQQALWKRVALQSVENILIFVDAARTQSLWLWMKREEKRFLPRRHHFLKKQPGDLFLSKLSALCVDIAELDEHGNLPITETANRVRAALDVETVTKAFFRDFQDEHGKLLDQIKGIPDARERRWYASVLLNRLMFVWFLQAKGFLDGGNRDYLPDLLAASEKKARGHFFSHVLRDLFFEGFAKPSAKRQCIGPVPLGDIPYLNGGLFLPHGIEQRIETDALLTAPYGKIRIADTAFADLFALFRRYSWSLNDTPGGDDREINPDVLGYIFEKYINQKEFGAYYTRPEITEYLCEQTIHQLVLDRANANFDAAQKLHAQNPKAFPAPRRFTALDDLLFHADGPLCARLLLDVLPRLSLLDPACGSGAFLVAAQKTLLNLYTALIGRCEALVHQPILKWMEGERAKHRHGSTETPAAYWLKKKIVTENLYGVDIMEEATEIAKLRLFLSLVASAEKRDQLEPLPNIEFNLLAGNSLIGLLHVDAAAFDKGSGADKKAGAAGQERIEFQQSTGAGELGMSFASKTAPTRQEKVGAHLTVVRAAKYKELLAEKNRLVAIYKEAPNQLGAGLKDSDLLVGLRRSIEEKKAAAREVLDRLLLAEFQRLGIQFQQATWDERKKADGKPEKRALKLDDIRALQPFHWAYEFDHILIERGGFDAIITNPPWENFRPDDKEFFMPIADDVSKNKMRLEDFIERKTEVLASDPAMRAQYLAYLSRFPHVNLWFRNSEQYENQTAIVNGRKATTDLNLYKLFLEQTLHLLHTGGYCGIVIPGGIYSDLGATRLRQMLFEKTRITGLFGFENRKQIFENVDSRFKFVVLTFRPGDTTTQFPAAFMRHDVTELVTFPEGGVVEIEVKLIRQLSPDSLSLVEFRDERDVTVARKLTRFPLLGADGDHPWQLSLHREFHMTDDVALFHPVHQAGYVPLVEGKMFHQFRYPFAETRYWLNPKDARAALLPAHLKSARHNADQAGSVGIAKAEQLQLDYQSYRLGFRAIGRNTDERTMIATVLPPNVFCGNSVTLEVVYQAAADSGHSNVNQRMLSCEQRLFLAATFNSFVFDFQLRQKVSANVSFFYVYQIPIPRLTRADAAFRPLVERAARLVGTSAEFDDLLREVFGPKATHHTHGATDPADRQRLRAESDALVAQLYALTEDEFTHILATFPLVPETVRLQTQQTLSRLTRIGSLA
jgi:hypothetical protein